MTIDLNADKTVRVNRKLKPGTAIRNYFSAEKLPPFVRFGCKIHTGGTNQLGNHHPFHAIDDKSSPGSHHRKIAEINFGLFGFFGPVVDKFCFSP